MLEQILASIPVVERAIEFLKQTFPCLKVNPHVPRLLALAGFLGFFLYRSLGIIAAATGVQAEWWDSAVSALAAAGGAAAVHQVFDVILAVSRRAKNNVAK